MIWNQLLTLHAGGAEALASEEDRMVVVLRMIRIAFLLHKGPTAHVLKAPGRVPSLDEADWLREENERNSDTFALFILLNALQAGWLHIIKSMPINSHISVIIVHQWWTAEKVARPL